MTDLTAPACLLGVAIVGGALMVYFGLLAVAAAIRGKEKRE